METNTATIKSHNEASYIKAIKAAAGFAPPVIVMTARKAEAMTFGTGAEAMEFMVKHTLSNAAFDVEVG